MHRKYIELIKNTKCVKIKYFSAQNLFYNNYTTQWKMYLSSEPHHTKSSVRCLFRMVTYKYLSTLTLVCGLVLLIYSSPEIQAQGSFSDYLSVCKPNNEYRCIRLPCC